MGSTGKGDKPPDLEIPGWADLNERQRTYLQAVYEVDQANEQARRIDRARGYWDNTPASEWRWIDYNGAYSPLLRRISEAGYQDAGTGSTFESLYRRGLIKRMW